MMRMDSAACQDICSRCDSTAQYRFRCRRFECPGRQVARSSRPDNGNSDSLSGICDPDDPDNRGPPVLLCATHRQGFKCPHCVQYGLHVGDGQGDDNGSLHNSAPSSDFELIENIDRQPIPEPSITSICTDSIPRPLKYYNGRRLLVLIELNHLLMTRIYGNGEGEGFIGGQGIPAWRIAQADMCLRHPDNYRIFFSKSGRQLVQALRTIGGVNIGFISFIHKRNIWKIRQEIECKWNRGQKDFWFFRPDHTYPEPQRGAYEDKPNVYKHSMDFPKIWDHCRTEQKIEFDAKNTIVLGTNREHCFEYLENLIELPRYSDAAHFASEPSIIDLTNGWIPSIKALIYGWLMEKGSVDVRNFISDKETYPFPVLPTEDDYLQLKNTRPEQSGVPREYLLLKSKFNSNEKFVWGTDESRCNKEVQVAPDGFVAEVPDGDRIGGGQVWLGGISFYGVPVAKEHENSYFCPAFEVEIEYGDNIRIGWGYPQMCKFDLEDVGAVAYESSGILFARGATHCREVPFKSGDIISSKIDYNSQEFHFYKNGNFVAKLPLREQQCYCAAYAGKGKFKIRARFDQSMKRLPEGATPVATVVRLGAGDATVVNNDVADVTSLESHVELIRYEWDEEFLYGIFGMPAQGEDRPKKYLAFFRECSDGKTDVYEYECENESCRLLPGVLPEQQGNAPGVSFIGRVRRDKVPRLCQPFQFDRFSRAQLVGDGEANTLTFTSQVLEVPFPLKFNRQLLYGKRESIHKHVERIHWTGKLMTIVWTPIGEFEGRDETHRTTTFQLPGKKPDTCLLKKQSWSEESLSDLKTYSDRCFPLELWVKEDLRNWSKYIAFKNQPCQDELEVQQIREPSSAETTANSSASSNQPSDVEQNFWHLDVTYKDGQYGHKVGRRVQYKIEYEVYKNEQECDCMLFHVLENQQVMWWDVRQDSSNFISNVYPNKHLPWEVTSRIQGQLKVIAYSLPKPFVATKVGSRALLNPPSGSN